MGSITPERAIFLYHLRVNPNHVTQITGSLKDGLNAMCAVGLGCDAFNIPMTEWEKIEKGLPASFNAYQALADKLGVTKDVIAAFYSLNDHSKLTFAQVAKVAEVFFERGETDPYAVTRIYHELQGKGEL